MGYLAALSLTFLVTCIPGIVARILRKKFTNSLTALNDIRLLSVPRSSQKIRGTAVICGGSIAGLFAARICSDHFDDVVIIESEAWLSTKDGLRDRHREQSTSDNLRPKRSHVAQYTSKHLYHAFIGLALQRLFPDMEREFEKEGARTERLYDRIHISGIPIVVPSHLYPNGKFPKMIWASRPLLETTLRRMMMETCSNVRYIPGSVKGLVQNKKSSSIRSVVVRDDTGAEVVILSSLVIDCTGASLGGLRWLKDLTSLTPDIGIQEFPGISPLDEIKITYDHKMAYTTCEYDVPPRLFDSLLKLGFPTDYNHATHLYITLPDTKTDNLSLYVQRREKNFVQMACGGWNYHVRISSISDVRSFLAEMTPTKPVPQWLFTMLDLFETEAVPATYVYARCPPSVYIQYHRVKNLPSNFIAIGDSIMQVNPVLAYGCAKACVEAVTLNAHLLSCKPTSGESKDSGDAMPNDFSQKFFAAVAKRTGHIWGSVKNLDYEFETTSPIRGEDLKTTDAWIRAYTDTYMRLATKDQYVAGVWFRVFNLLAPPTDAFLPGIVFRVAWEQLKTRLGY